MKFVRAISFFALVATALPASATDISTDTVILRALDKVTARVNTLTTRVGQAVAFGTLEIVPQTCVTRPPEEPPENAAFLEVFDTRPETGKEQIFSGWMFGSSPALSALDHPVYDIWVLRCEDSRASTSP